ncbi:MAG: AAA family ATPase [Methylobacteriaceae bacterium]|nr:AAA family ATPase [Methylobacteriaceae bacterium]
MRDLLIGRGKAGFVRRCHGDLHLRNIVSVSRSEPVLFDAVEFDDEVATGDVLYDLAFLLMDLEERGLHRAGNVLLNRYLWDSDEAQLCGLAALPVFLSIRSAIRAKVVAAGHQHLHDEELDRARKEARRYFQFADEFLQPTPCRLIAVGGPSGTGKSTLAAELAPRFGRRPGAVLLRSDIERKKLFGAAETAPLSGDAYSEVATQNVYAQLRRKASSVLKAGHSVVVDAVHARQDERGAIEDVARGLRVDFSGLWLDAPLSVCLERVAARKADASDADAGVVRSQAFRDVGPVTWQRLDVSGSDLPNTLAAARLLLAGPAPPT